MCSLGPLGPEEEENTFLRNFGEQLAQTVTAEAWNHYLYCSENIVTRMCSLRRILRYKGEGKVHPETDHEGPEGV